MKAPFSAVIFLKDFLVERIVHNSTMSRCSCIPKSECRAFFVMNRAVFIRARSGLAKKPIFQLISTPSLRILGVIGRDLHPDLYFLLQEAVARLALVRVNVDLEQFVLRNDLSSKLKAMQLWSVVIFFEPFPSNSCLFSSPRSQKAKQRPQTRTASY